MLLKLLIDLKLTDLENANIEKDVLIRSIINKIIVNFFFIIMLLPLFFIFKSNIIIDIILYKYHLM